MLKKKLKELKELLKNSYYIKELKLEDAKNIPHLGLYNENDELIDDEDFDFDNFLSILQLSKKPFRKDDDMEDYIYLIGFTNPARKIIYFTIVGEDYQLFKVLNNFDKQYEKN